MSKIFKKLPVTARTNQKHFSNKNKIKNMDKMDEIFKDLEKQGRTDVNNLVQWMKDSKLIEATKEHEAKVKQMLKEVGDVNRVELEKFKEVLEKLAIEQKKTVEQLTKQLAAEGPRILDAAMAGLQAFREALEKK